MNAPITIVTAALGVWVGAATLNTGQDLLFAPSAAEIKIHSLEPANGGTSILQDRTVYGEGPVVARWQAQVRPVESEDAICEGSGFWQYATGRKGPVLGIDTWTGDVGCLDRMRARGSEATFQACAQYKWADSRSETACTLSFRVSDIHN